MFNWLKNFFNKAIGFFRAFMKEVFTHSTELILAALKDVAMNAVTKLAQTDLSNEEKRKQAFQEIKDYAISEGIQARDSLIFLIIEMCITSLKNAK